MNPSDDVIRSHGLPRHPTPQVLARQLRHLADTLEHNGTAAIRAASILAARGYPAGTLGDGGASNGASILVVDEETGPDGELVPCTSTEAAALNHDRWNDADRRLARLLRLVWSTSVQTESLAADLLAHAQDVDELPAGTGSCEACTKVCRPTVKNPDNRLRSGLCDACRKHWARSGITDRGDWLLTRRALLGHKEGAEALAARFAHALDSGEIGEAS